MKSPNDKIQLFYYFCHPMKIFRDISLRLLFSFTILLCLGVHPYSTYNSPVCIVEIPVGSNTIEKNIASHVDSSCEDQLNQPFCFTALLDSKNQKLISSNIFVIYHFCLSIWQPPKIS